MTSNYQRALYNGFKLEEQWKYEVDKYINTQNESIFIVVYDARNSVCFGDLIG